MLGHLQVCTQWLSKLLSEQTQQWIGLVLTFLELYNVKGKAFLDIIVKDNQTCVLYIHEETKIINQ